MASTLRMLLAAALLTSGCVTLAPQSGGSDSEGPRARTTLRQTAASTPPFGALSALAVASAGRVTQGPATCGGEAVPPGWPDFSSGDREALLAPFLTCNSPAEFLALQERVDMPRLVEVLDDWRAVRLGAQGPPREEAARLLNRKRVSFLVDATERYGAARAQVFSLYIVDSAHDDDLREILYLLAQDKRLEEMLALLPAFQSALEKRGLKPTARPDRDFEMRDLGRGLARAGRDALSSSPLSDGATGLDFSAIPGGLPPDYQEALDEAEKRGVEQHFSAGNVALGSFDHLTFGVPLGFYDLLAGTGHGAYALAQGRYEQATRELAPAALLVALYVGGKGVRYLAEARGSPGPGMVMELRLRALEDTARRLEGRLGVGGLRELARYLQASREAGRFVAVGGPDAAMALYEARGDVARARPLLSRVRPGATGSYEARGVERPGGLASLVDEGVGHTREVVQARLAAAELESSGSRLSRDVRVLEKQRPSLDAPPSEARGNPRWREYVDYYEKRLGEVTQGTAAEGPLRWEAYEQMRGWFARGLAFERTMVMLLEADAQLPRAQRRFLGDFDKPRIETQVGVRKPGLGLRYADMLVIEEGELGGRPRRVETFSFKSRDLSGLGRDALTAQIIEDASEALRHYGERLDIRRTSLQSLLPGGSEVQVPRVRLIYEGGELKPTKANILKAAVDAAADAVPGVEVSFQ
ncbi:hypothetical protein [Archangium sp.]|uniref:hypothetical protein n=1 Tax=Archangium sp. TaxID=1872627 RepID=UPI00389AD806